MFHACCVFVVRMLSFIVCCWLFVGCSLLCGLLCVVYCCVLRVVVCCLRFAVCCLLFVAYFAVWCLLLANV